MIFRCQKMDVGTQVRRLFKRSVSRYFALKILVEKRRGNIIKMGEEILKSCPISYSLQAVSYSAWRGLKKLGFIEIKDKNAMINTNLINELQKEIKYIEQTVDRLNREGIFLKKSELGTDVKEIERRVAIIEILIKSEKGVKKQELASKIKATSSQIKEDIRAISKALNKTCGEDFVGVQVSNKGLWMEYYLPFKNISFI